MAELEHRSIRILREHGRHFRRSWKGMSRWVLDAKDRGVTWPDWCLLPLEGWVDLRPEMGAPDDAAVMYETLGAWRLSKGIYRLSHDFSTELLRTPITGDIPVDVLKRLPEWCVYLDLEWVPKPPGGETVMGAWVWLHYSMSSKVERLAIAVDFEQGIVPLSYELEQESVSAMVDRYLTYAYNKAGAARQDGNATAHVWFLEVVLKFLLYLCSEEPEISDREEPEASPSRVRPKSMGPHCKFVAADRPRFWVVGEEIGKEIRKNRDATDIGDRKHTRRHLRRAHWHGYWVGPRDSADRKFIYKWLSPMVVGPRIIKGS